MTAVLRGPRRPVNIRLNEALVREVRELTPDLSETVEVLLAAYIEAERLKRAETETRIENTIDFAIAHFDEFGVIGAEYAPV
jgi:antitoxin CcdA